MAFYSDPRLRWKKWEMPPMNCAWHECETQVRGDAFWIVGPETGHPMFCSYEHLYLYAKEEVEE